MDKHLSLLGEELRRQYDVRDGNTVFSKSLLVRPTPSYQIANDIFQERVRDGKVAVLRSRAVSDWSDLSTYVPPTLVGDD